MRKILFIMVVAFAALVNSGCSKDSETPSNARKGIYKMVVTQTGDIDYFDIFTTVNGGNGLNNGVFDESGVDLGMTYNLTNEEKKRSIYAYQTAKDGVLMIFVQTATCKDLSRSMTTNVKVYFNGEIIDDKSRTFKGTDTSPFNITWSQVEN